MREHEVVRMVAGLRRAELRRWLEEGWVTPPRREGAPWFREIDIARLELMVNIRRDAGVPEDCMPLVLSLVDQVYGLRNELRRLAEAIEAQPHGVRKKIAEHCRRKK